MDSDPPVPPSSAPKKPKFKPKPPRRPKTGPILPKDETGDDDGEAARALLSKANERLGARGTKAEKTSSSHVASSHGAGSSPTPKSTSVKPKDGKNNNSESSNTRDSSEKGIVPSSSSDTKDGDIDEMSTDDESKSLGKTKEYKEPSDYSGSNYPTVLPWIRPNAGNSEHLKEEDSEEKEYVEKDINSALELELLEEKKEPQMIFFQFPLSLPLEKQRDQIQDKAKGKEKVGSSNSSMDAKAQATPSLRENTSNRCSLEEFPGGHMGKMLVYKSGAIKLKLGDHIFDVSSGIPHQFAEDVCVMNYENKVCCVLEKLKKRAVVTPNIDSILDVIP